MTKHPHVWAAGIAVDVVAPFKPRQFAIMVPNVIYDFGKCGFEKYFRWKTRKGLSFLP